MEEFSGRKAFLKDSKPITNLKMTTQKKSSTLPPIQIRRKAKKQTIKSITTKIEHQNFTVIEKKKNIVDFNIILKSLNDHYIFSSLMKEEEVQTFLINEFQLCKVDKGNYLMKQNDPASSFFILHEGDLDVEIFGQKKRKIEVGECFGELSLLYSSPRSAGILAVRTSFLWFIDRNTFRKGVSTIMEKNYKQTRDFIEKNQFFVYLTNKQKDEIASYCLKQKFSKRQKICRQGELGSSMFIVKSGIIKKMAHGIQCGKYYPGDFCQEDAILAKDSLRKYTLVTQEDSEIFALGKNDIERVLGSSLALIIIRNKVRSILLYYEEFRTLSSSFIDLALDCFKIKHIEKNQKAILSGTLCKNNIFLILQGEYRVSNLCEAKMYGYQSIKYENDEISYNFDLKFTTPGKIAWTTKEDIIEAFQCSYEDAVTKTISIQKTLSKGSNRLHQLRLECENYKIYDFEVITKIGEGQCGTVFLVTNDLKKKFYALKCVQKDRILKNRLERHIINEKKVLSEISSSPFCVDFIRTFKDFNVIYFLTEFINGLELFEVLRMIGLLNLHQTRFYTAIMLNFIETLHAKNIIYRDLKPENMMVCEDGYIKFIDMGTCKQFSEKSLTKRTYTIIGTLNYMAPEVISGKGYSFTADLWSLGVILFEFLAGYVPFGEDSEDPYETYEEILKQKIQFPKYMKNKDANSLIMTLLSKAPESRLNGSYHSLTKHPFFNGFDWEKLVDKSLEPPFLIPKNKLFNIHSNLRHTVAIGQAFQVKKLSRVNRNDIDPHWDEDF